MKPGDFVRHKLSGDTGTIKRVGEFVATVTRDRPYYVDKYGGYNVTSFIAKIENLEITGKQEQLEIKF